MITYCYENCPQLSWRDWSVNYPIVAQNSTIVQAGEQVEITAGLFSFRFEQKPDIYVYEKKISLDANGFAIYKLKAAAKPGKYYVPLKINYTDQDGRQQSVQKEIEYTVANIQQQ